MLPLTLHVISYRRCLATPELEMTIAIELPSSPNTSLRLARFWLWPWHGHGPLALEGQREPTSPTQPDPQMLLQGC
jgi:hypothetical protein